MFFALGTGCRPLVFCEMHVGTAINVFSRYGYFSISMRVVPRNDSDRSWIFREPTVEVFKNISGIQNVKRSFTKGGSFDGDFHLEFCDNVKQLLQAYFRDFSFERLDRPWKAFTGSWSKSTMARNMGLNLLNLNGEPSYILVRVARHREVAVVGDINSVIPVDRVAVHEDVQREIDNIIVGDASSVVEFVKSFGSHYITSYITGNSLYQVFTYEPNRYQIIKQKMKQKGISKISSNELMEYFSPIYTKQIGRILSASGNATVEQWAMRKLTVSYLGLPFNSLLRLHANARLLYELDDLLGNEALLKLNLKTLAPIFKDPKKREWFHEVIDNNLKLWEENM